MPVSPSVVLPKQIPQRAGRAIRIAPQLLEAAHKPGTDTLNELATSTNGLSAEEVERRLEEHGPNVVAQEQRFTRLRLLGKAMVNPLVILLLVLAALSYFLSDDVRAAVVMLVMVVLGVTLRFVQESRADAAAAKLKAMISVTATVVRDGKPRKCRSANWCPATSSSLRPAT